MNITKPLEPELRNGPEQARRRSTSGIRKKPKKPSGARNGASLRCGRLRLRADGKALSMPVDRNELPVAFAEKGDVVVNFGIVSGREATQAELDRLAVAFRRAGAGPEMTITAERRQDYGRDFEGVIHQVRVTLAGSPTEWVEAICRAWALNCAEDRRIEPLDLP